MASIDTLSAVESQEEKEEQDEKFKKHPILLFFHDERLETEFEQKRSKTRRQMVSLVMFHVNTIFMTLYHRLLQVEWDTSKFVACLAMPFILGTATVVLHYLPSTKAFFNKHYGLVVILTVLPVHICLAIVDITDELEASPGHRCPAHASACPHHAADSEAQGWVMISTFILNLLCPVLFKYQLVINLSRFLIHTVATCYFPSGTEVYGCIIILFAVQAGTLSLAYVFESQLRSTMVQDLELQEDKLRIASILSTVLPPRLILKQFSIPLIEKYEDVPVLFCSFDKQAVLHSVGPQAFFDTLEAIYTLFDEAVACAGMWKVEHVGEDYVVSSPGVATQDPKDNTPEARREHAAAIANLALALVREGNSFAQSKLGGSAGAGSRRNTPSNIDFKFKAGIHNGPLIGGVAGRTRRFYRLFGETVVMAARMCHHCETGRVQVSGAFDMLLGSQGPSRSAGRLISVKGKQGKLMTHYLSPAATRPLVLQRTPKPESPSGNAEHYKQLSIQLSRLGSSNVLDRVMTKRTKSLYLGGNKVSPLLQDTQGKRGTNWALDSIDLMDPLINTMFRGGDDDGSKSKRRDASVMISNTHSTVNKWTGAFVQQDLEKLYLEESVERHRILRGMMLKNSLGMFILAVVAIHCMGDLDGWDFGLEEMYVGFDEGRFVRRWYSIACLLPAGMLLMVNGVVSRRSLQRSELDMLPRLAVVAWMIMLAAAQVATNSYFKLLLQFALNAIVVMSGVSPLLGFVCTVLASILLLVVNVLTTGDSDFTWVHAVVIVVIGQAANMIVFVAKIWMLAAERKLWVLVGDKLVEKDRKREILTDLLPPYYAKHLLKGVGPSSGKVCMSQQQMACVLFSDLSGFTALNDKLGADAIVQVMHGLWCCFDSLVQKHDMYKMDTVGDAYVVIALCNSIDGLKEACQEMVLLAQEMIVTLEDFSTTLEENIAIRIGIDCGDVIAGVMGRIQPRFHAHGAVVANAQRLEGMCIKGSILVSPMVGCQLEGVPIVYPSASSPTVRDPSCHSPLASQRPTSRDQAGNSQLASQRFGEACTRVDSGGGDLSSLGVTLTRSSSGDTARTFSLSGSVEPVPLISEDQASSPLFHFSVPVSHSVSPLQAVAPVDSANSARETPDIAVQAAAARRMSMGPQQPLSVAGPSSPSCNSPESVIRQRKSTMLHGNQFTDSAKAILDKIREASDSVAGTGVKLSVEARCDNVVVRVAPADAMKSPIASPSMSPMPSSEASAVAHKLRPTSEVDYHSESMDQMDPNTPFEIDRDLIVPHAAGRRVSRESIDDSGRLLRNSSLTSDSRPGSQTTRSDSGSRASSRNGSSPVVVARGRQGPGVRIQLPTIQGSVDHVNGTMYADSGQGALAAGLGEGDHPPIVLLGAPSRASG